MAQQSFAAYLTDALDIIQNGVKISFVAQLSVVGDGKAMYLILYARHQLKALRGQGNSDFPLMKQQTSGAVSVILHHPANRDVHPEGKQHLLCGVYLRFAAIHQD